jgi:hypothetical protein
MQEPRGEGTNGSDRTDGNVDKPQKQPTGISAIIGNPLFAAFLTAASSLIIFSFNQVKQIDARLDELEKEARLLLTPDGTAAASKEALEAYYGVQTLKERFAFLEGKLHFHD